MLRLPTQALLLTKKDVQLADFLKQGASELRNLLWASRENLSGPETIEPLFLSG